MRSLSYRTAADQAPWLTLFTQKRSNLVSERYGGYHYGAVKTTSLGLRTSPTDGGHGLRVAAR